MNKKIDPKMHTAEHILNQTMVRMFQCDRCFSAHIEKKKSKCDYRFERSLSDLEIQEIENRVNEVIRLKLPVTDEMMPREEALQKFDLDRLPGDAGENIRIVRIGDYDACPCAGEHVCHTGETGTFHIVSSSFENDVLRIRFKLKK